MTFVWWFGGSKSLDNCSTSNTFSYLDFKLQEKCQSSATSFGIQLLIKFSPLNITNGGIAVPSVQIHWTIVIHSWGPGWAWYFFRRRESTTTKEVWIVPIAKPRISSKYQEVYPFHPYYTRFAIQFDIPIEIWEYKYRTEWICFVENGRQIILYDWKRRGLKRVDRSPSSLPAPWTYQESYLGRVMRHET